MRAHQGSVNKPLVHSHLNPGALSFDPQRHFELTPGPYFQICKIKKLKNHIAKKKFVFVKPQSKIFVFVNG